MNKKEITKNLYDLEYAETLERQSLLFIIIATFLISFVLGDYSTKVKGDVTVLCIFVLLFVHALYQSKLSGIKKKIQEL